MKKLMVFALLFVSVCQLHAARLRFDYSTCEQAAVQMLTAARSGATVEITKRADGVGVKEGYPKIVYLKMEAMATAGDGLNGDIVTKEFNGSAIFLSDENKPASCYIDSMQDVKAADSSSK